MADTILKSKVQLRSVSVTSNGSSNGGDKTPTTPSKLMLNHGKPNFTIQRSTKAQQNGDGEPFVNNNNKNNNYNAYKTADKLNYSNNNIVVGTKFNGAFKSTNVTFTSKQPHQTDATDNEAAKVVLRRAKAPEPTSKDVEDEDDSVPEFIRRQRRIQERLAKENVLDFESRRSGYFTHVMISPTSPNRQSFGATMSSPPVVPALETPAPAQAPVTATATTTATITNGESKEVVESTVESVLTNGNSNSLEHDKAIEEEEVAKAIEEVNKAVEGEDDEIKDEEPIEVAVAASWETESVPINEKIEHVEFNSEIEQQQQQEKSIEDIATAISVVSTSDIVVEDNVENNIDAHQSSTLEALEATEAPVAQQNGHIEIVDVADVHTPKENGHNDITISHTNGFDGPSIPAPDPSGALGVNYEPKTVVSFSKDLGSEPNNYPDTVKTIKQNGDVDSTTVDEKLQELSKLKFDIKADEQDLKVTPVIHAD